MLQIRLLDSAEDDLKKLDKRVAKRVVNKLFWLAENFYSLKPESLSGDLSDFFKLRVGDYRVIYAVLDESEADKEELILLIHKIGHRREVYKN